MFSWANTLFSPWAWLQTLPWLISWQLYTVCTVSVSKLSQPYLHFCCSVRYSYCISQHPEFFLQRSETKPKCRAGNFQYLHILLQKKFSQVFFVSDSFIKQSQRRTFFKLKIEFLILYLISTGWIWATKILCWRERTVPGVYWMDSW